MARTLRIEITTQEEDGRMIVKTLEGEDAEKWSKFVASVCTFAQVRNANPNWGELIWQKKEMTSSSER